MIMERLQAVNHAQAPSVYQRIKNIRFHILRGRCYFCSEKIFLSSGLCSACISDMPINNYFCQQCCEPLENGAICGKCLITPPKHHKRILAPFRYEYPLNKVISKIKFNRDLNAAKHLSLLASMWFKRNSEKQSLPDLILPVPLHKNRMRWRGYNQSLLLARPVSLLLQIPVVLKQYGRKVNTKSQINLDARQRRINVRDAFYCDLDLAGKRVVIFDDVITTGATTEAFAKTLHQAGADEIEIWAIAKRSN